MSNDNQKHPNSPDLPEELCRGSHTCELYEHDTELGELLAPFFREGLVEGELCFWAVPANISLAEAKALLLRVVPGLKRHIADGSLEFVPAPEWYLRGGEFHCREVIEAWKKKYEDALGRGFTGLRASGDLSWIEPGHMEAYRAYETEVNRLLAATRMTALCTISTKRGLSQYDLACIIATHTHTFHKKNREWSSLENPLNGAGTFDIRDAGSRRSAFVENFHGIAFHGTLDFKTTFLEGAVEEITGYTAAELTSDDFGWVRIVHTDDRDRFHAVAGKAARVSGYSTEHSYRIITRDGSTLWVQEFIKNVCDASGRPAYVQGVVYDITERKNLEEKFTRKKHLTEGLLDSMSEGLVVVGLDGRMLDVNPALSEMTGFAPEELIGTKPPFKYWPESDRERLTALFYSRLGGEPCTPEDLTLIRKDGTFFDAELKPFPINDSRGGLIAYGGLMTDVTERKKAEESVHRARKDLERMVAERTAELERANRALTGEIAGRKRVEDAQARLIAIIEATPDLVSIVDAEKNIMYCNSGGRALMGVGEDTDISGTKVSDVHPPDVMEMLEKEAIPTAVRKGAWSGETRFITPDGRHITTSQVVLAHKGDDGRVEYFSTIARDISRLKDAEDELTSYARAKAAINEILRIGLGDDTLEEMLDASLKVVAGLPRFSEGFRWAVFTVEGERLRMRAQLGMPETIKEECAEVSLGECVCGHAAEVGKDLLSFSVDDLCGDRRGDTNDLVVLCVPVPINYGDTSLGVLNVHMDPEYSLGANDREFLGSVVAALGVIIRRKLVEEEKESVQDQLLASQRLEAIGKLAGGVAHDFNNIMTVIKSLGNLSMKEGTSDEDMGEYLRQIISAAERASKLTDQLLILGSPQPTDHVRVDLASVVKSFAEVLTRLLSEKITLTTDLPEDGAEVLADRGNMEQLIMNLVLNARDATMPEGGEIILRVAAGEAAPGGGEYSGSVVSIEVEDHGEGMAADVAKRIFEPFYTTKALGKGTGLGLSVVKSIVDDLEGAVEVKSLPGKGTTFRVLLPEAAPAEAEAREEAVAYDTEPTGPLRILLVEDEQLLRKSVRLVLAKSGYEVVEAGDMTGALKIFEEEGDAIDLLFSDTVLPDGTGVELAVEVTDRAPGLHVLLVSGYIDIEREWPVIKERGFMFLRKPFDPDEMLDAVSEASTRRLPGPGEDAP